MTPYRKKLPATRPSLTHKSAHGNMEFYVTVGFYDSTPEDRCDPAEVFVKVAKHGSDVFRFVDGWATILGMALQYGVPWGMVRNKFINNPHPDMLEAVVRAVDLVIEERKKIIGHGEEPQHGP